MPLSSTLGYERGISAVPRDRRRRFRDTRRHKLEVVKDLHQLEKLSQGPVRRPAGLNSPATRSSAGFVMWRANKGDVLNCCGKMPSLRKARLPGSCNLPEQFYQSNFTKAIRNVFFGRACRVASLVLNATGRVILQPQSWLPLPPRLRLPTEVPERRFGAARISEPPGPESRS